MQGYNRAFVAVFIYFEKFNFCFVKSPLPSHIIKVSLNGYLFIQGFGPRTGRPHASE